MTYSVKSESNNNLYGQKPTSRCVQFATTRNNRICYFLNVSSSCDSPEKLKAILPRLEQELKDTGKFKDFYQFTFNFAKNPGQKGLGKR